MHPVLLPVPPPSNWPMQIITDESFITISYSSKHEWLYANWVGEQDIETVKKGCNQLLFAMQELGYKKVLNDNRGVIGNWSEAADWVGTLWFPEMVNAGLRYFAWVLPSNFDSRIATELTIYYTRHPVIATFDSLEDARSWLQAIAIAPDPDKEVQLIS